MHAYRGRVCLLSVSVDGTSAIVDAVALRGRPQPLGGMRWALEDPGVAVVVHGGEHLVAALKRDHAIATRGIWDAQQAAALLAEPRTGLDALARRFAGAALGPPVSVDWSQRPLTADLVDHGLDDVRHLEAIASALAAEIRAHDLDDELAIQHAIVEATPADLGAFHATRFYRLPGASRLDDRALRVLRALDHWRDATARRLDIPSGRLVPNAELVALARAPERAMGQVGATRFHSLLVHDDREALRRAVEAALDDAAPLPKRRVKPPPSPAQRGRRRALKRWRTEEAARRGVSRHAILPRAALRYLIAHGAGDLGAVPQLGERRRVRYGEVLATIAAPSHAPASDSGGRGPAGRR